jgi:replicative DNA helicase
MLTRKRSSSEILDMPLPRDHECERSLLACLLTDPPRFDGVAKVLAADDFDDANNRIIFESMLALRAAGNPIDITLLVGRLRDAGQYDADRGISAATLTNLRALFPSVAILPYYVARLKEMSRRRRARVRGEQILQRAHSGDVNDPHLAPAAIRRATRAAIEHRTQSRRGA